MSHPSYYGTQDEELDSLWLEALGRIKGRIPQPDLKRLFTQTSLVVGTEHSTVACKWARQAGQHLILVIHPDILATWYPVERAELFLFAAAMTHLWLSQDLPFYARNQTQSQRDLCRMLDVVCSDVLAPSERWRRAQLQQVNPLSLSTDPFHSCHVCGRFVNSDEPRSKVHNNCMLYVKSVVVPQLKEWQRLERVVAAGEMEK